MTMRYINLYYIALHYNYITGVWQVCLVIVVWFYRAERQTDQTGVDERLTSATLVGVSNEVNE